MSLNITLKYIGNYEAYSKKCGSFVALGFSDESLGRYQCDGG